MLYFLFFLSLIGWFQGLRRLFPQEELTPVWIPFCFMSLMSVLFFGGLLEVLLPTAIVAMASGLLIFCYDHILRLKEKKYANYLTPGLIFFLVLSAMYTVRYLNSSLYSWDEFGWGVASKDIVFRNGFFVENSAVSFIHYPPGGAILHYFFLFGQKFSEGIAYCSMGIFFIACFAPLADLAPKKIWVFFLLMLLMFYIKAGIGGGLQTLLMDDIFGATFGCAIVLVFFVLKKLRYKFFLIPFLVTLVLLKPTGIVLAGSLVLVLCFAFLLDLFSLKNRTLKDWFFSAAGWTALCVTPLITHKSWGYWLTKINAKKSLSGTFPSVKDAVFSLFGQGQGRQHDVFYDFFFHFFRSDFFAWFLGCTAFFLLVIFVVSPRVLRMRWSVLYIAISSGWALFLGAHLFAYLFLFSDYEAKVLISFERYQSVCVMAFCMACIATAFALIREGVQIKISYALIAALLLGMVWGTDPGERLFSLRTKTAEERLQLAKEVSFLQDQVPLGSRIWVIFQHTVGLEKMILAYELAPSIINFWYWTLGSKSSPDDVWTNEWSLDQWQTELRGYDFVYIGRSNQDFWQRYSSIFSQPVRHSDCSLYRVSFEVDRQMKLTYVDSLNCGVN